MIGKPEDYEFSAADRLPAPGDESAQWAMEAAAQGNLLARFAIYETLEKEGECANPLGYEDGAVSAMFNFAAARELIDLGLGDTPLLGKTGLAATKIYIANMIGFYDQNPRYARTYGDDFFPAFCAFADSLARVRKPTHDAIDAHFFRAHAHLKNMPYPGPDGEPGASAGRNSPKAGPM